MPAPCNTYDNNELLQKCGCHLNQTHDGEDVTEFSLAKNDWGLLKAGV